MNGFINVASLATLAENLRCADHRDLELVAIALATQVRESLSKRRAPSPSLAPASRGMTTQPKRRHSMSALPLSRHEVLEKDREQDERTRKWRAEQEKVRAKARAKRGRSGPQAHDPGRRRRI